MGAGVFGSLRRGQRRKAERYVSGLLGAPGRKSLRNIAEFLGDPGALQGLHHFVSESAWEWGPVRRALAGQAWRALGVDAWVVKPLTIPKAGERSVGVAAQFVPELGRAVNGQLAVGVWLMARGAAVPVEWQLVLPRRWREEPLRGRARIPGDVRAASLQQCVLEAVDQAAGAAGVPRRPVVVDVEGVDGMAVARHLWERGHEFIVRVGPGARLGADVPVSAVGGTRELTAGELAARLARLRRPVGAGRVPAAALPVVAPGSPATSGAEGLRLVGEWPVDGPGEVRLWLAGVAGLPVPGLLGLTGLGDVVAGEALDLADRVGLRDFTGRSFAGWHRHVTLASVAHFAAVLGAEESCPDAMVCTAA
ncbi:IS701 family transposase [Streptomyces sp. L500]